MTYTTKQLEQFADNLDEAVFRLTGRRNTMIEATSFRAVTAELIAALDALIAAVEAGKGGDAVGYYAARVFNPGYAHAINAYHGSLDAARALHDALLPGWVKWNMQHSYFGYECDLTNGDCDASGVSKDNPARSWLLAILRAIKSQVNYD